MKKLSFIISMVVLCFVLAVGAFAANTVYVTDGGNGDGSSASSPLGDMSEAILKVADGGKVVIVGTYTCAEEYREPLHNGDIIISGEGNGTYCFTNGSYNRWFLSGPGSTTFENINFTYGAGSNNLIVAQFNKLILGEGITFCDNSKCYVVGGYMCASNVPLFDNPQYDLDSDITVKSGTYWLVGAFSRGASGEIYTGTGHITIEGGEIGTVYGAGVNGTICENAIINVSGGTISNLRAAGDATRRLNGNSEINISGGSIGELTINNVMGHATVNYTGGYVALANKSVEMAIEGYIVDGTATLNVAKGLDAKMLALAFDEVNEISAPAPATTTAVTTVATSVATTEATTASTVATTAATTAATAATTVATTVAPATDSTTKTEPASTTVATTAGSDSTTTASTTAALSTEITTEATTVATEVTTVETKNTTAATTTATTASVVSEEGGVNIALIIGIAVAVVAVIVVVIIVLKKKKN